MISGLKTLIRRRKTQSTPSPGHSPWTVMSTVVGGNPLPSPGLALKAIDQLRELCPEPEDYLHRLLRMTALHRAVVIQQHLLQALGPVVVGGPFEGMTLSPSAREGCYTPKLLGCYESALHTEWRRVIQGGYSTIVNIGCADGYYAVGLARLLPEARIYAYDCSAEARESCRQLACLNGVEARIQIQGEFHGPDFGQFQGQNVYVVCDIEGAERDLLNPRSFTGLEHMDLLVEMHQIATHQTETLIRARFEPSHFMERIDAKVPDWPLPSPLQDLDELDKFLAVWEWRVQPTPWLLLRSRKHHSG